MRQNTMAATMIAMSSPAATFTVAATSTGLLATHPDGHPLGDDPSIEVKHVLVEPHHPHPMGSKQNDSAVYELQITSDVDPA